MGAFRNRSRWAGRPPDLTIPGFLPFSITDPNVTKYDPNSIDNGTVQNGRSIDVDLVAGAAYPFPRNGLTYTRPLRDQKGQRLSFPWFAPDGLILVETAPSTSSGLVVLWGVCEGSDPTSSTDYVGGGLNYSGGGAGPLARATRYISDQTFDSVAVSSAILAHASIAGLISDSTASRMRMNYFRVAVSSDRIGGSSTESAGLFPIVDIADPYEFITFGMTAAGSVTGSFQFGRMAMQSGDGLFLSP